MRIVILEDDPKILELEEMILGEVGYEVTAINHYMLMEDLIDFSPELVLLDVRLSGGYGHLLCKDFKSNPLTNWIPIILISGSPNLPAVAADCQANGYLSKPFDISGLLNIVKQFEKVNTSLQA